MRWDWGTFASGVLVGASTSAFISGGGGWRSEVTWKVVNDCLETSL